jgi:hypothetical protein
VIEPGFASTWPRSTFLALGAAQQHPDIVPGLAFVQELTEHLHPRAHRLLGRTDTDDLELIAYLHDPALHAPRHHRAPARDREHVLDRHQERLVDLALGRRHVGVQRLGKL